MKSVTTEAQYKQYFSDSFQGMNSLIYDVLSPIFGEFTPTTDSKGVDYVNVYGDGGANIEHIYDYGKFYTDNTDVSVFEVVLSERCHISRARKGIKETVSRITDKYSGAFIVFHYPERSANAEAQIWRLSWLKRLDVRRNDSPAKRYTYLCGPSYSCRTIAQRFVTLYKEENKTLDSITKAFDAEALSDEFFKEYKVLYDDIIQWITGQRVIKKDNKWQEKGSFGSGNGKDICDDFLKEFENIEETKEKERQASKAIRDYVKKMLGRLVFIQFLQKKGYLGIDGKPTQNFLLDLFNCITDEQKDNFIDTALEQVVYLLLNSDDRKPGSEVINNHTLEVPFLNGGLFERDKWDEKNVKLPKEFFHNEQYVDEKRDFRDTELRPNDRFLTQCGILDLFNHYNFTIDENDPNDAEVGVDPEMLGKIFENLLEDNKEKGAFYTPKEIVQYMCRESLIAYLQTGIEDEGAKDAIRQFVTTQEIGKKLPKDIDHKLQEVKICDPAIGSGAFPMGLLNLLVALREKLEPANNRCKLKKDIIQKNIYGVDIERGAIDIARLRFWLSIMVDEDSPTPLPNFDYKFMQGNSLLEQYKGIDLSTLSSGEKVSMQTDIFQNNLKQFQSQLHSLIELYYNTDNHKEKRRLKKEIQDNVNNQMKASGVSVNFTKLGIDVAGNDQFFLWHTWFQDVFENGKFDIVIGNPPYIEAKKLKYIASKLKKQFDVYSGTADLSIYFAELGLNILNDAKGILCFITTNKFFNTGYGKKIRELFSSKKISKIINFEQVEVFKDILVSSVIIEIKKANRHNGNIITYEKFYKLKKEQFIPEFVSKQDVFGSYSQDYLDEKEWSFSDITELVLKSKIEKNSQPLADINGVSINRGVTTGYNPAFIIDDEKRKEIVEADANNNSIIKNMLQGRNIRKWYYNESDENLIFTKQGINIESYPIIKQHLFAFYDALRPRLNSNEVGGRKPGDYKWFEIQDNTAYYPEFERPEKIIWGLTADKWAFTIDEEQHYLPSNGYILTSTEVPVRYILGLLNSKLMQYYFHFIGIMTAGGAYTLKATTISALPIKIAKDTSEISLVVDEILSIKKHDHDADVSDLENKIDQQVYVLYNLTPEEIAIIEKSTKAN